MPWCLIAMVVMGGETLPATDCSFMTEAACRWKAYAKNHKYEDPTKAPHLFICGGLQSLQMYQTARLVQRVVR